MATVLIAGGGTAGHVEPALALAEVLRDRGHQVLMLGTATGAEAMLVPARDFELLLIDKVVLPRSVSADAITLVPRMQRAVSAVRAIVRERHVDAVVGFGGYVAMPAYLAARSRVPYVVFSYDAKVGIANRIGARGTRWRAVGQPGTMANAVHTGVPMRRSIVRLDRSGSREVAARHFGVDPNLPTLLVFGGSLGARRLNDAVVGASSFIRGMGWQVVHVTGRRNEDDLRRSAEIGESAGPAWIARAYVDQMNYAYSIADFIISRAGAMTCAELACVGVPAALVPYAVGNGEQELNAAPLVASGGYMMIADKQFSSDRLSESVGAIMRDPSALHVMTSAAQAFAKSGHITDGAERLADLVEKAIESRR